MSSAKAWAIITIVVGEMLLHYGMGVGAIPIEKKGGVLFDLDPVLASSFEEKDPISPDFQKEMPEDEFGGEDSSEEVDFLNELLKANLTGEDEADDVQDEVDEDPPSQGVSLGLSIIQMGNEEGATEDTGGVYVIKGVCINRVHHALNFDEENFTVKFFDCLSIDLQKQPFGPSLSRLEMTKSEQNQKDMPIQIKKITKFTMLNPKHSESQSVAVYRAGDVDAFSTPVKNTLYVEQNQIILPNDDDLDDENDDESIGTTLLFTFLTFFTLAFFAGMIHESCIWLKVQQMEKMTEKKSKVILIPVSKGGDGKMKLKAEGTGIMINV